MKDKNKLTDKSKRLIKETIISIALCILLKVCTSYFPDKVIFNAITIIIGIAAVVSILFLMSEINNKDIGDKKSNEDINNK